MTFDEIRALAIADMAEFKGTGARGPQGNGLRGWCEFHGVNLGHASAFLSGKRSPASDLLEALGLEWRVVKHR